MKNRKCPNKQACWGYTNGSCDDCEIGKKITSLEKRIERLKKRLKKAERPRGECEWCKKGQEVCGTCKRFYGIHGNDAGGKCSAPANEVRCVGYDAMCFCPKCGADMEERAQNDE